MRQTLLMIAAALPGCSGELGDRGAPDASVATVSSELGTPAFCASYPRPMPTNGWEPDAVHYGTNNRLAYRADAQGNTVPDFAYIGYKNGTTKPPVVAEVERVSPGAGDDTARIQAAIDRVGARPVGANGFRGAVALDPGDYQLGGVLRIDHDGVVLRGSGRCGNASVDTRLIATGDSQAARVVLGSGVQTGWDDEVAASRTNVDAPLVVAGVRWLPLADSSKVAVGDTVVVVHPITQAWIDANGGGGTGSDPRWKPGDLDTIRFKRRIVGKLANFVELDAPIFNHLDRSLTTSYVARLQPGGAVARVGIENLRVDSEVDSDDDEQHAKNSIEIIGAEDAWVRNVVTLHFSYAGIRVTESVRVTVQNVDAVSPVGPRDAGWMYNFAVDHRAQLVLFVGCTARNGRHHFVSNGTSSVSGVVFLRSTSDADSTEISEGHRRWSQGLLYDMIREIGPGNAHLGCRGAAGTSHGWSAVHSVLWNHDFDDGTGFVEKPPTGQNYAFGAGPYRAERQYCSSAPAGHIEQRSGVLRAESLYEAQLCDRFRREGLNDSSLDFRPATACPIPPKSCSPGEMCCEPIPGGCRFCAPVGGECP